MYVCMYIMLWYILYYYINYTTLCYINIIKIVASLVSSQFVPSSDFRATILVLCQSPVCQFVLLDGQRDGQPTRCSHFPYQDFPCQDPPRLNLWGIPFTFRGRVPLQAASQPPKAVAKEPVVPQQASYGQSACFMLPAEYRHCNCNRDFTKTCTK